MTIGIVQLNTELEFVSNSDAPCVGILQALGQGLRQVEIPSDLVPFGRVIYNIHGMVLGHFIFIDDDCPRRLVRVAQGPVIFRVEREIVAFHQLRADLSDPEALEQRDQSEIHLDSGAENDGFGRGTYRILDLIWPDIFNRL